MLWVFFEIIKLLLNSQRFAGILCVLGYAVTVLGSFPALAYDVSSKKEDIFWEYEVKFSAATSETVTDLLTQSSRLLQLKSKPPASLASLRRRINEDVDGFDKVLRSEGYYSNKVDTKIDQSKRPVTVLFTIETGPQYKISQYRVDFKILQTMPPEFDPAFLGVTTGMPARSETIVAAQKRAITEMRNRGFPEAGIFEQEAIVDFDDKQMDVTLTLKSGPFVRLGKIELKGLKDVKSDYLRRLSGWMENVPYNRSILERLRQVFLSTGLFDSVSYEIPKNILQDKTVPVVFTFIERDHKSVGVGADYSTSEGLGASVYWENRNFLGNSEKLKFELNVSEIKQELVASFVKPNYLKRHQNLKAEANVGHENTDAYTENTARIYLGLDRRWKKDWTLGGGVFLEFSNVEEDGSTEGFLYVGLPLTAVFDSTDDLLDPSEGFRFSTTLTPHLGLNDVSSDFLITELHGAGYYSVFDKKRLILAARGKIGSILGESTADIPAVKRFFAGGGGSVRGYEYQQVGPLDADGDPSGGRSVVELGLEARIRITDSIGIVPFLEGGNVYEEMSPDLSEELQWAAGIGGRYYTPFGPLRLDVAFPLNPRSNKDDTFQFYISIGQAF